MASPKLKRKAHLTIASPRVVSWRDSLTANLDIGGTATRTVPLFRATHRLRIMAAAWMHENAVDGTKTVTIRNLTKGQDLTGALTINGLGALGSAAFVPNIRIIDAGDRIGLVYTVTVAGTVAPGACNVFLDVERLDEE